jgi:hypothetical protein
VHKSRPPQKAGARATLFARSMGCPLNAQLGS